MLKIKIAGVAPFEGTFDADLSRFNGRELHLIKELSGVRLGEIEEALNANDYDVVVAIAVIALVREGRVQKDAALRAARELMEADMGKITLFNPEVVTGEVEEGPPSQTPIGVDGTSESSSPSSSSTSDDLQETPPSSTGQGGSPTGAESPSPTLVS